MLYALCNLIYIYSSLISLSFAISLQVVMQLNLKFVLSVVVHCV